MKKILFLAVAALLTANAAFAQLSYGVKGGLNLANVSNADKIEGEGVDVKMKPSFYLGALAEYRINDLFGVAGEIVYSRQGYKSDASEDGYEYKQWVKLDYINVPILAKVYLLDNLSLEVGPQFGFMMSNKYKWEATEDGVSAEGDGNVDGDGENDMGMKLNKFDVSVGLGLSYNVCENIFVNARYNLGLTDLPKDNNSDDKFKNNVIQVGVGYKF